jgi:hypothetical protein
MYDMVGQELRINDCAIYVKPYGSKLAKIPCRITRFTEKMVRVSPIRSKDKLDGAVAPTNLIKTSVQGSAHQLFTFFEGKEF